MAKRIDEQDQAWLPSGFPPRSFPPAGAVMPPARPDPAPGRGRGRWLAAAAVCAAVILLAGALLLASRDGGDESVATGPDTSDTSLLPETSSTVVAAPPSIDPVSTTVPGASTTILTPAEVPGVLEPVVGSLSLPRTDASVGVTQARLTLRNTGPSALNYTAQSSSPALTASPARGTIPARTSRDVVVTLDGTRVPTEGLFTGTLSFSGTGGDRAVQVQSIVGQPPEVADDVGQNCSQPSPTCSQQIALGSELDPGDTPCTTTWYYAISVSDQSRIRSARAIARFNQANADAALQRDGTTNVFESQPFNPLPDGSILRFTIEIVDEHGFTRLLPEQTISCPA